MDDIEKFKKYIEEFVTTRRSWACFHRKKQCGTKRYTIGFVKFEDGGRDLKAPTIRWRQEGDKSNRPE